MEQQELGEPSVVDFLNARIIEDEAEAEQLLERESDEANAYGERILAECEAKRQVIDLHVGLASVNERGAASLGIATRAVMKLLAGVYSDHPDYRQEWAVGEG